MDRGEARLVRDLMHIQGTQEDIGKFARYMELKVAKAARMVELWRAAVLAAPAPAILPLIYLANDVCQRSRRKQLGFERLFIPVCWGVDAVVPVRGAGVRAPRSCKFRCIPAIRTRVPALRRRSTTRCK